MVGESSTLLLRWMDGGLVYRCRVSYDIELYIIFVCMSWKEEVCVVDGSRQVSVRTWDC